MKHSICLVVIVLTALATLIALASPETKGTYVYYGGPDYFWNIFKDIEYKKRVYVVNTETDQENMIYETDKDFIVDIRVSPADTVIAVLITERGIVPPGAHEYSVPPRNSPVPFLVMATPACRSLISEAPVQARL